MKDLLYELPPPYPMSAEEVYHQRLQQEHYQRSMYAQHQMHVMHRSGYVAQQQRVHHHHYPAQQPTRQQLSLAHRQYEQSPTSPTGPLPIVIPQTSGNLMRNLSPFMRAYAPQLELYNISQATFLAFIDGLNEAFISSPALQCVGLAGTVVSFAPSGIAMAVGTGLSLAAGVGGAASSIVRTKAFINRANAELFEPHGLSVKIASSKDMMAVVGVREDHLRLLSLQEPSQLDASPTAPDPRGQRMQALHGRVAELDTNVPAMQMPDSVFRKMGAWQAKRQDEKDRKKHLKQCKEDTEKGGINAAQRAEREQKEQKANKRLRWIVIVPTDSADVCL